uniref:Small integral membrane protein 24 n=1 Tax=Rousettus aegyptiacus TaxID=9407 RepID=A0A7J8BVW8_ROUAE|nr:small integral membrane protein 24 [Rousettus aegyptiacus]
MRALETALVLSALLLLPAEAQNGRRLKPWLVGLTVVVVFLFVVFVLMLAHRIWCSRKRANDDESMIRMESDPQQDPDLSKEGKKQKKEKEKKEKKKEKEEKEKEEKEEKKAEEGESNLGVELEDEKPADQEKTKTTDM